MEDHLKNKDRLEQEWIALCAYEADCNATTLALKVHTYHSLTGLMSTYMVHILKHFLLHLHYFKRLYSKFHAFQVFLRYDFYITKWINTFGNPSNLLCGLEK